MPMNHPFAANLFAFALVGLSSLAAQSAGITHYALEIRFMPKEQRIHVDAALTVKNFTDQPRTEIPFVLYRLLNVREVKDSTGAPLSFRQEVTQFSDDSTMQVRTVTIPLPQPLGPGQSMTISLKYNGAVFGYPEVMAYVKDRISEEYSLVRPDAFSYPMLAEPSFQSVFAAYRVLFTYEIKGIVPDGYAVACGGELTGSRRSGNEVSFTYRSKIPTWRMDIAAAKFLSLEEKDTRLILYALPEDETGGRRVLKASREVLSLYVKMFGKPMRYQGYTIIEIPDGWGSQASDFYFLQTAAAFKDSTRISEVYHEIGHTWNVKPKPEIQGCRWFDEAFASYFESLALRAFNGEEAFLADMEKGRELFVRWANYDKRNASTPIADYAKEGLGRNSYTKGAWSLYVLHSLVGDDQFKQIIRTLLNEFKDRPADFQDFQEIAERISKKKLDKFLEDWIFGVESSRLLTEKVPINEIVGRYR